MSKKMNANEAAITATTTATRESLQSLFEQYPNASLRKLAAATEVNYGIQLKKRKDPSPG